MSDRQVSANGSPDAQHYVVTFPFDPLKREFELAVTLRMPPHNTRIPDEELPTAEELEIIQGRTMLNWSNVMFSLLFDKPLPDVRFAGINAVRRDNDVVGVVESDGDMPYCTVLNITNYYKPGICVTIHSYDDGTIALENAKALVGGYARFDHYLAKNAEENNGGIIRVGMTSKSESPTPDNVTRIGQHADSLPDTPAKTVIDFSQFKPYIRKTRNGLAQGLVALETGQDHNFNIQAIELSNFQYNQVPYDDKQLVIVPITGAASVQEFMKDKDGVKKVSRSFAIAVAGGSTLRIFDWYDNDKANFEWAELAKALGTNSEGLRALVGQSFFVPAHYITMKVGEYEGTKKYKFHGFYHNVGETVNEKPMLIDIPF